MNAAYALIDIAHHFGALTRISDVKVVGTQNSVIGLAMDGRLDIASQYTANLYGDQAKRLPSVLCYAKMFETYNELANHTVGLGRLEVLNGFAAFDKEATVKLVVNNYGYRGKKFEIEFNNTSGSKYNYVLSSATIANLIELPPFTLQAFDAIFTPEKKDIMVFKKMASDADKKNIKRFWCMMNRRGNLYFSFDEKPADNDTVRHQMSRGHAYVPLAPFTYPAQQVLEILKLAETSKTTTMSVSNKGYLKIDVTSDFGEYKFIILGSSYLIQQWNQPNEYLDTIHAKILMHEDKCMHGDWEPDLS